MADARQVLLLPNGSTSHQWPEFAGASNLIGWRYRGSADSWIEFKNSVELHGDGRDHDYIYKQEHALFVMFSAGVSCIESTCYNAAAAASHPKIAALSFGDKEQRLCSPSQLLKWLLPNPKAAALLTVLQCVTEAPEWKLYVDLRNRMTHRSNLPRRTFASMGGPPPKVKPINYAPTSSTKEIDADLVEWDALHRWLADSLRDLLVAGAILLRSAQSLEC